MLSHKEPFLFRIVPWFIGIVFVIILLYWVAMAALGVFVVNKASQVDTSGGIKPIIEKVWCGHEGCLDEKK